MGWTPWAGSSQKSRQAAEDYRKSLPDVSKVSKVSHQQSPEDKLEAARKQLDDFIVANPAGDKRNTTMPGIQSLLYDMPTKFSKGFYNAKGEIANPTPGEKSRYYRKDGSLNTLGKNTLRRYQDERPEYARQMNRLRKSSPEMFQAYGERFPWSHAAMEGIPKLMGSLLKVPISAAKTVYDNSLLPEVWNQAKKIAPEFTDDLGTMMKDTGTYIAHPMKKGFEKALDDDGMVGATARTIENIGDSLTGNQEEIIKSLSETETNDDMAKKAIEYDPATDDYDVFSSDIPNQYKNFNAPELGWTNLPADREQRKIDQEKKLIEESLNSMTRNPNFIQPQGDLNGKMDFVNEVFGTNFDYTANEGKVEGLFEKAKQAKGMDIRKEVNAGNATPRIGEFDLTTINEESVPIAIGGQGDNYDYSNYKINEDLSNLLPTTNTFLDAGVPAPIGNYSDGTPMYAEDQTDIFDVGSFPKMRIMGNEFEGPRHHLLNQINKWGNAPSASEKNAYDILNSLGNANGGYMNGGSTNNYNNMSTYQKLKMMADNYGN